MELTDRQLDILSNLIENEIESDEDFLTFDLNLEEREHYTLLLAELKEMLLRVKPLIA